MPNFSFVICFKNRISFENLFSDSAYCLKDLLYRETGNRLVSVGELSGKFGDSSENKKNGSLLEKNCTTILV